MLGIVGGYLKNRCNIVVEQASLFCRAVATAFTERKRGGNVVREVTYRQILFTGVEAIKIVFIIALILGVATIVELTTQVPRIAGQTMVGTVLVAVVVRELGPLITAFIIIGRSGTAIAAEIGNMMVNHEIEAIDSMGIDPMRFIVLPRILGVTLAAMGLGLFFVVTALAGGFFGSRFLIDYPFVVYLSDLGNALGFWDVVVCFTKCALFGVVIATVCCYRGFSVKFSSHEVPQVVIKAVVACMYTCFLINIIVTGLFYL